MISAGQQPTPVKSARQKNAENICAAVVSSEVPANFDACMSRVTAAMNKAAQDNNLNTPYKNSAFDTYVKVGVGFATVDCANRNNISFGTGQFTPDKYEPYASCMRNFVVGSNAPPVRFLNFDTMEDMELDFDVAFIPYAAKMAGRANEQHIPLPANLIKFMSEIAGIENGFFAREAERLFRQAMANVPANHKLLAARDGGVAGDTTENDRLDDVIDTVAKSVAEYQAAKNPAGKEAAKENLIRTYVSRVELNAPEYTVTFNQLPKELIVNIFGTDKVPPAVAVALRRLLADAMKKYYDNGGDPKKEASVNGAGAAFEQAVKGQGIDPEKPDEWLSRIMLLRVEDVPLKADKSAEKVVLGEAKNAKAPGEVLDGAHSGPLADARQELWNDIQALLEERKVAMTPDVVIALLARPKSDDGRGGIAGMDAVEVASMYPVLNEQGQLSLSAAPPELFAAWQKIKDQSVPDSTTGTAAIGGHRALVRIYAAALRDGWRPELAAHAIDKWVQKVKDEENSAQTATHRITGASYGGMDGSNMIIKERDGSTSTTGAWVMDDFTVAGNFTLEAGPLFGVDREESPDAKPGANAFMGYMGVGVLGQFKLNETSALRLHLGGDALGAPRTFMPGASDREAINVATSLEDGSATFVRMNRISLEWVNRWNHNSKDAPVVDLGVEAGLTSKRTDAGEGLSMTGWTAPSNHYQPLAPGGSGTLALKPTVAVDFGVARAMLQAVLGSARGVFLLGEGGFVEVDGAAAGAVAGVDVPLISNDDVKWKARAKGGYQRSFGDIDPQFLSGVLVIGGSTSVQLSNGVGFGVGGSYGRMSPDVQDNVGTLNRFLIGVNGGYSQPNLTDSVGMHTGLGISHMQMSQDTRIAYDPAACEGGYSCQPGGGADVGDPGTGAVSDTGSLPSFITAGNAITEISPYIYFDLAAGSRFTLTSGVKVPIWIVENLTTADRDTAGAVLFVFGGEYDPSLFK